MRSSTRVSGTPHAEPWRVLVVDDEPDVHTVTRTALEGFAFEGRPVEILGARSAAEARRRMAETRDVALILLDVVMESERAGLDFVEHVRGELRNSFVRIVLRTGQPGQAPPLDVLARYEIDGHVAKTDLTYERLHILVLTALRTYSLLRGLESSNEQIERLLLEARAANQAKGTFLATMSHEIRTPLIGVLGMLEVLGQSRLLAEQRRQFNVVEQSARSLLDIVGDILDYSRIEAGKVELAKETFAVRDLVSRVMSNFSANAESKRLRLVQDVDPEVAAAHVGDAVRIRQVLANLVGNAVKFTERGSVTLAVRAAQDEAGIQHLAFSVTDTGIAIAPEQMPRLFQPFTQSDAATTQQYGGTGLGLVICQRLAELMGGSVRAESEPGTGTTMHLELRLPVGNSADLAAAAAAGPAGPLVTRVKPSRAQAVQERSLVLLAEDHKVNREVLVRQLDLAGFRADTAANGTLALGKFRSGIYGLVLTDLHMPGLDGFQLAAAIREFEAQHGGHRTPVIALTANVLRTGIERCFDAGMDDYLAKPVTVRQLAEKLRQWLPGLDYWSAVGSPAPAPVAAHSPVEAVVDESLLHEATRGSAREARGLLRFYCETAAADLKGLAPAWRDGNGAVARVRDYTATKGVTATAMQPNAGSGHRPTRKT